MQSFANVGWLLLHHVRTNKTHIHSSCTEAFVQTRKEGIMGADMMLSGFHSSCSYCRGPAFMGTLSPGSELHFPCVLVNEAWVFSG